MNGYRPIVELMNTNFGIYAMAEISSAGTHTPRLGVGVWLGLGFGIYAMAEISSAGTPHTPTATMLFPNPVPNPNPCPNPNPFPNQATPTPRRAASSRCP